MSVAYEVVVFEGEAPAVRVAFDALQTQFALRLFQPAERRFVLDCWQPVEGRPFAIDEVDKLAEGLSREFGAALAVHYDDSCGFKVASLYKAGSPVREFGEADEVWTPVDDRGYPLPDGPRYPGDAIPKDVECDCIRQAIDVGLEAAGFAEWLTAADLRDDWIYADEEGLVYREGTVPRRR